MNLKMFQVDAFANRVFEGNPAAVCLLEKWLHADVMQNIAMENNLAETAFLVQKAQSSYELRWFTPAIEVDLCGHATLASAHILKTVFEKDANSFSFETRSGELVVEVLSECEYKLDFPADHGKKLEDFGMISDCMGVKILECYRGKDDFLAITENENIVLIASPDLVKMKKIDSRGIILSAVGHKKDFVSRGFFPNAGIDEDPVTGSAHTLLTPYWSNKLDKKSMTARQISRRGGDLICEYHGERIHISGKAVTYMEAIINI